MSTPIADAQDRYGKSSPQSIGAGVVAGVLGILFGLFGIFTLGFVFVPLAGICSAIGFLRGIGGRSPAGIGLSVVGGALTIAGFMVSPSLWFLAGVGAIASSGAIAVTSHLSGTPTLAPQANRPEVRYVNEVNDTAFLERINGLVNYVSGVEPALNTARAVAARLGSQRQR